MERVVDFPNSDEEPNPDPGPNPIPPVVVKKAKTTKTKMLKPTAELLNMPQFIFQMLQNGGNRIAMRVSDLRKFRNNYLNKQSYNSVKEMDVKDMYNTETPYIELNCIHQCIILRQGNHRCESLYQRGYKWMAVRVDVEDIEHITGVKCIPGQDTQSDVYMTLSKEPLYKHKEIYKKRFREVIQNMMGCEILDLNKEYTAKDFYQARKAKEPNWQYRVYDSECASIGCERTAHWKCSNCEMALYCSPTCQSQHWKDHKEECH